MLILFCNVIEKEDSNNKYNGTWNHGNKQPSSVEAHPSVIKCSHLSEVITQGCKLWVIYFLTLNEQLANEIKRSWLIPSFL